MNLCRDDICGDTVFACSYSSLLVGGSNAGLHTAEYNPGQVVNTHVPLSPSSIIWYQPIGSDALWLEK